MNVRTVFLSIFRKVYRLLGRTPLRRVPGSWNISNILFKKLWRNVNIIEVQGMRKTFQAYGLNLVHEEATTALFKKIVKPGDVILDLGANIGYFTLLAAKLAGAKGRVYAFEPEPNNFKYLRKNLDMNDYKNVLAYQKAVSAKNGKTRLFICPYDSGHHTINQSGGIEKYRPGYSGKIKEIEIDVVALDDFIKEKIKRINVIKVDVEGAEVLAFEGMRNILKQNRDIKIFLEFFPLLINEMGNSPEAFVRQLQEEYEFSIFAIARDYSLSASSEDYIRIYNYAQLMGLLQGEADHANLFLTRSSEPNH